MVDLFPYHIIHRLALLNGKNYQVNFSILSELLRHKTFQMTHLPFAFTIQGSLINCIIFLFILWVYLSPIVLEALGCREPRIPLYFLKEA